MKILAIDPSTTVVGFAMDTDDGPVTDFVNLGKGPRQERLGALLYWVDTVLRNRASTVVVYYTPFARGRDATRSLWGAAGVIEAAAAKRRILAVDMPEATVRAYFGIKSTLKKAERRADLKQQSIAKASELGYNVSNDDEADAALLYHYAKENVRVNKN